MSNKIVGAEGIGPLYRFLAKIDSRGIDFDLSIRSSKLILKVYSSDQELIRALFRASLSPLEINTKEIAEDHIIITFKET